jgi:hypothetical protein
MTFWDNPTSGLYELALNSRGLVLEIITECAAPGVVAFAHSGAKEGGFDPTSARVALAQAPIFRRQI